MVSCFSRVRLFATLWTVACQSPLSVGFPRQEYWSGLQFPAVNSLGIFPTQGSNVHLLHRQADSEPPGKPNSFFTRLLIRVIIFRYDTELHIKIQNSLENKQFGDLRCENSAL